MKILVVGAGSIGRRHIQNLNDIGYTNLDLAEVRQDRIEYIKSYFDIGDSYTDYREALKNDYDTVFVLTPPSFHMEISLEAARKGFDLFIEKPLSNTLNGVDELKKLQEKEDLIIQVGYNLRYDTGLNEIKRLIDDGNLGRIYFINAAFGQYLPNWRPTQDYRDVYTAIAVLGGGILLDASHEFDYITWLSGGKVSEIRGMYGRTGDLDIDVEDFAEALLLYDNGIVSNIHLDMLDETYNRYCRVIGEKGTIQYRFVPGEMEMWLRDAQPSHIKKAIHREDTYIKEIKDFFRNKKSHTSPLNNLDNAIYTLKIVQEIKDCGKQKISKSFGNYCGSYWF